MKAREAGKREAREALMMTPMIDIVFQLLVFFIMTFTILAPEGDFNIKMPAASLAEGPPPIRQLPPMTVRLKADQNGRLSGIELNDRTVSGFPDLRTQIRRVLGDDSGPGAFEKAEVKIDADYNLRYEYVIETITAVCGYVDPRTGLVTKLIEKVEFAPPHP